MHLINKNIYLLIYLFIKCLLFIKESKQPFAHFNASNMFFIQLFKICTKITIA